MTTLVRGTASLVLTASALATLGALSTGCSVIFHVDANQCAVDGDCRARGAAFNGYTCNKGQCDAPIVVVDAGDAGDAGTGGCKTNQDCPLSGNGEDVACDVSSGQCL